MGLSPHESGGHKPPSSPSPPYPTGNGVTGMISSIEAPPGQSMPDRQPSPPACSSALNPPHLSLLCPPLEVWGPQLDLASSLHGRLPSQEMALPFLSHGHAGPGGSRAIPALRALPLKQGCELWKLGEGSRSHELSLEPGFIARGLFLLAHKGTAGQGLSMQQP